MVGNGTIKAMRLYYDQQEKLLRSRLAHETDIIEKVEIIRTLRAIKGYRSSLTRFVIEPPKKPGVRIPLDLLPQSDKLRWEKHPFGINTDGDDGDWITVNGTHVQLGEGGAVKNGPLNLKGKSFPSAKSQKKEPKAGSKQTVSQARDAFKKMSRKEQREYLMGVGGYWAQAAVSAKAKDLDWISEKYFGDCDSGKNELIPVGEQGTVSEGTSVATQQSTQAKAVAPESQAVKPPAQPDPALTEKPQQVAQETQEGVKPSASGERMPAQSQYRSLSEEKEAVSRMTLEEKAAYLVENGVISEKTAGIYLNSGSDYHRRRISELAEENVQKKTEEVQALKQHEVSAGGERGHISIPPSCDGDKSRGRALQVMRDTGLDYDGAKEVADAIYGYSSSDYRGVRAAQQGSLSNPSSAKQGDLIESYIASAPKWNGGTIYRGIGVSQSEAQQIISSAKSGELIDQRGTSSWTSTKSTATSIGKDEGEVTIVFRTPGTKQGVSIKCFSKNADENEVIVSKDARWRSTGITKQGGAYIIDCEEVN